MELTKEQQALLDGEKGPTMAKVMKTLVQYGEIFGAEKMVPVTGKYGHLVLSFGLSFLGPVFDLYQKLIDEGCLAGQKFTCDPRPYDKKIPQSPVQKTVAKAVFGKQARYEKQLRELGLLDEDSYTCTCYLDEIGNVPKEGDVLSWAESSAVVYANSVLGARCNRNSGIIELFGSVAGYVPYFGFLTDEGRKADWIVELKTSSLPDAQILGSAIGMKVMEEVPYVKGLDKFLGTEITESVKTYLKDFGAATASNGAVGLYHIENLTPEAKAQGEALIKEGARIYVVDDAELKRVKDGYPCVWKDLNASPKLCFLGCPHMTLEQMIDWTKKIERGLKENGRTQVTVPTVFTASTGVIKQFNQTVYAGRLAKTGVVVSFICPLMFMDNPTWQNEPVITSSNKLRTYTTARFYDNDEILSIITGEGK